MITTHMLLGCPGITIHAAMRAAGRQWHANGKHRMHACMHPLWVAFSWYSEMVADNSQASCFQWFIRHNVTGCKLQEGCCLHGCTCCDDCHICTFVAVNTPYMCNSLSQMQASWYAWDREGATQRNIPIQQRSSQAELWTRMLKEGNNILIP